MKKTQVVQSRLCKQQTMCIHASQPLVPTPSHDINLCGKERPQLYKQETIRIYASRPLVPSPSHDINLCGKERPRLNNMMWTAGVSGLIKSTFWSVLGVAYGTACLWSIIHCPNMHSPQVYNRIWSWLDHLHIDLLTNRWFFTPSLSVFLTVPHSDCVRVHKSTPGSQNWGYLCTEVS